MFASEAIRLITEGVPVYVEKNGRESWKDYSRAVSKPASNYAGIAFSNSSVGAVHALSYPLGAVYHLPHGESNQLLFTEIYRQFIRKGNFASIKNARSR